MGGEAKIKLSKSKIFFVLSLGFILGAFVASFFDVEKSFFLILFAGAIAIFIFNHRNRNAWLASAFILFVVFGLWRTGAARDSAKNNLADRKIGPVDFVGRIAGEPEVSEKYQKIIIRDDLKNNILINADVYPTYQYGDQLKVSCILEEPKNYEDSNFDYQMYLAKDGIYRICNKPSITLTAKYKGSRIFSAIIWLKNKFEERLSVIFPDPEGAYLKGLLLGGSKRMTDDIAGAFSRTGTTHTLAVSGYNVTVVAAFLMWLGIYLGLWRQQVFSFALLGIIFFVLATGSPASAVRAGIMGGLVIWAMKEGRLANSENAILLAGSVMLIMNPLLLRYDAGFQLSFLATLGIVYLSPVFEKYFERVKKAEIIKETIFLSVAAQIFVLPVILANFESISLISPFANLLILPAIPFIMLGGFIAGMAGFIFIPLGKIAGFVPYIFLKIELWIVQWLAHLPWASLEIKNFGWKHTSVYYIILVGLLLICRRKQKSIEITDEK